MITRTFEARIKKVGRATVDHPVQVTLMYNPAEDPHAVEAVFEAPGEDDRVWTFGRELLADGSVSRRPHGQGDVKFRHFPRYDVPGGGGAIVMMCLTPPEGHADIALPYEEVASFLEETTPEFLSFAGDCDSLIDEFLKEVFGA